MFSAVVIMSKKIEMNVQYSVKDYFRGIVFSQGRSFFHKYGFLITGTIALMTFIATYLLFFRGESIWEFKSILALLLGLMITFPVTYLLKYYNTENHIEKQYNSSPLVQEMFKISFDDDGIFSEYNSFSSKINWSAVTEANQTDEDFYFFTSPTAALFIPKRVFTQNQQTEVIDLVKIKLGDKVKF